MSDIVLAVGWLAGWVGWLVALWFYRAAKKRVVMPDLFEMHLDMVELERDRDRWRRIAEQNRANGL